MNKEMVAEMIIHEVRKIVGQGTEVAFKEIKKNNGVMLQGVVVRKKDCTVAPVIYIDKIVSNVGAGRMSIEDAAKDVARMAEQNQSDELELQAGELYSKDYILNNVGYRMVNAEKNSNMLQEMPHKMFEDLAALYEVRLTDTNFQKESFLLKKEMISDRSITEDELDDAARKNDSKRGFSVKPLGCVLEEMMGAGDGENTMVDPSIVIITNGQMTHGASAIMFEDTMKRVARFTGGDFYILPSSIHELLAIPVKDIEAETIRTMVKKVNDTEVASEEILSYNVYRCDSTTGKAKIVRE